MFYRHLIRPLLFRMDPENVHGRAMRMLRVASGFSPLKKICQRSLAVSDPRLGVTLGKINLPNPVGLAAGFDKNIEAPGAYEMMGFGFAELGSVTSLPHGGNPRPRLWRLPKDRSLIVYYGLANCGAERAAERLRESGPFSIPIGISIAPHPGVPAEDMAADYARAMVKLFPFADYITLNVSCPNVACFDVCAQVEFVRQLLQIVSKARAEHGIGQDFFVKIGPEMAPSDLASIVEACAQYGATGIIATNLVKNRALIRPSSPASQLDHPGGISGKLLEEKSNAAIRQIYKLAGGRLKIIGAGGVFTAEDAYKKILCGASAVQLITGFVYGGPLAIREINRGLLKLLKRDGFENVEQAVGRGD